MTPTTRDNTIEVGRTIKDLYADAKSLMSFFDNDLME